MSVTAGAFPAGVQQTVGAKMKHKEKKHKGYMKEKPHHKEEKMEHKKKKHDPKKKMGKGKSKVSKVMHEFKADKLHSGSKKGPLVHNPRQAVAIALSEARKAGAKIKPAK